MRWSLFIPDKGRFGTFHLKDDMLWQVMGGSGHCQIVTSLDQDVTVDVLTAKSCRNSNCTFRMIIKSSSLFDRINKDDLNYSYWQILSLVCPLKNHVTVFFIPSILKRLQRWQVSWMRSIVFKTWLINYEKSTKNFTLSDFLYS